MLLRLLLPWVAPVVLLTACGSSTSPSPSESALTAFIGRADSLCGNASATGQAIAVPTGVTSVSSPSPSELSSLATYWAQAVTVFTTLDSRLKGLGTPPAMQTLWAQVLADLDTLVAETQSMVTAAQSTDVAAYNTAYAKFIADGDSTNMAFAQFGARRCAGGASSSSPASTPTPR